MIQLRELAIAAKELDHNESKDWYCAEEIQYKGAFYPKNARFIAATTPDVVLSMIENIDQYRALLKIASQALEQTEATGDGTYARKALKKFEFYFEELKC